MSSSRGLGEKLRRKAIKQNYFFRCKTNYHEYRAALGINLLFLNLLLLYVDSIYDYMFEESVCLLLRASWFKPLDMEEKEGFYDDMGYFYAYEDEEEEYIDEVYFGTISRRIGNRRWGDNGYVRSGRQEARPVLCPNVSESSAGPSRLPRKIEAAACKESASVGRRAKRALKREAADKAAAAKHQKHLVRLGRK
ncbi:OLC1v1030564C1 [Oldenlandia corymbosa var. corymbosa]|uniref:OLC1v1030564C1 n=1 Tax=Oldenlandia corymbosa var. corymbosa TaxID=529605 RepID=A0AAV1CH49_OLDCO|nr:OLC1v1030564C1 [Oldenlandia corymbosa var. corymbosa]